jgi:hypothetical protein
MLAERIGADGALRTCPFGQWRQNRHEARSGVFAGLSGKAEVSINA